MALLAFTISYKTYVTLCQAAGPDLSCWAVLQTIRVAANARQQGSVGRVMVVLLTDGRANVSLAKSNDNPDADAEKPSQVLLFARSSAHSRCA